MTTLPHERRGVVLATALYFLAVLGVLVVGTLYASRGARAGAEGASDDATLTAALDLALTSVVAAWNAPARATQPVGVAAPVTIAGPPGATATASVTRLGSALYLASADVASARAPASRRRATLLLRILVARPLLQTPVVSQGDVVLGADARIVLDSSTAAECPAPAAAAVAIAPDAALDVEGTRAASDSFATVRLAEAASGAAFEQFGSESWSTLGSRADVRLPAGATVRPAMTAHESCVASRAPDDWSDRTGADGCVVAPPIVLSDGDLTIESGAGTGILLVSGRLRITGSFVFTGVIVARGGVEITGDGVDLTGSVLAARLTTGATVPSGASLALRGRSVVHASSCATYRLFATRAGVRSVHARAWLERF